MKPTTEMIDPEPMRKPRRKVHGASAVLLPFDGSGLIDWAGFDQLVSRTLDAGLAPAVNMDTGFAALIDQATRIEVLNRTRDLATGREFMAGAYVTDQPGDPFSSDAYAAAFEPIVSRGGVPVVFPSYGLGALDDEGVLKAHQGFGETSDRFIGFELSQAFLPSGRIYSETLYRSLLSVPQCIGAKHSSLHRVPEWNRLAIRDEVRPDFRVYTGNDLAIDLIEYGSDYLLGLSAFSPEGFAQRDAWWKQGDSRYYELNDALQAIGDFAFRPPVPAYRHSAAMFLKLRGLLDSDQTHPGSVERPAADREVLATLLDRLNQSMEA